MSEVIAIANQKGGVGKTTTTANLAYGLAKKGYKILAIDLDPQGSLTLSLGTKQPDELDVTVADIIEKIATRKELPQNFAVQYNEEGVDYIPANICLSGMEMQIAGQYGRERLLKKYIDTVKDIYDVILIDCMPSLGIMTINALVAADTVIIPTQAEYLSTKGFELLFQTIDQVRMDNVNLDVGGILITMVDARSNDTRSIISHLRNEYEQSVFTSQIPRSVRASETASKGISIYNHAGNSTVAKAYENFVSEVERKFLEPKILEKNYIER